MRSIKMKWMLLIIMVAQALYIEQTENVCDIYGYSPPISVILDEAFAKYVKASPRISCRVVEESLREYQDVTQLVGGTTLRSLPYNTTYEVESLRRRTLGPIAMNCTVQHFSSKETVEFSSLLLPQLSLSVTDGSTTVTLEENLKFDFNLTNRIELRCNMEGEFLNVQLCLQVAQDETCTEQEAISSEVLFKPGVEIPVTCRSRFMDMKIKSTLSEPVNIDSVKTFNLKFENASVKVLGSTANSLNNQIRTCGTKMSGKKFDETSLLHLTLDEAFGKSVKVAPRISCRVTGKSLLMEYQDVTQLVDETTLRSLPYNITYEVKSLGNNYIPGPIAMVCKKHNFGNPEYFEIASLVLPLLSVSMTDSLTAVTLEDNLKFDLHLTNRIELRCHMETTSPKVQLCLQVAQNETCTEQLYLSSEVSFKPGVEIPVTCRSRFMDMRIKSTLSEPVNIDSVETFKLKFADATASVSDIVVTTFKKTTETSKPSIADTVITSTDTTSTVAGQMDLMDPVPKTREKAVLSTVPTAETSSILYVLIGLIGISVIIPIMLVIWGFIYIRRTLRLLRRVPPPTTEGIQNADEGVLETMLEQNNVENHSYYYPVLNIQPGNNNGEASQYEDVEDYELEDTSYYYPNLINYMKKPGINHHPGSIDFLRQYCPNS